ncbi:MAG: RbsD/FucU family protein [Pirellulales bacterium]
MLKHELLHPQINAALGRAGHSAKVLIADGNFPASSACGPKAEVVSLNLSPGVVNAAQVLRAIVSAVPIERADVMMYHTEGPFAQPCEPPVWAEFRRIIGDAGLALELTTIERFEFYRTVSLPDHVLTIQTAEQQKFGNILLTIGVR